MSDFSKSQSDSPDASNPESHRQETLRLDHFLKTSGITETGGQAKVIIQNGEVKVNGQIETKRRRQLVANDIVEIDGTKLTVTQSHFSGNQ